jgi:hypothetical protein
MYTESSRAKQMEMSDKCWSLSLAHHYRITDHRNNWILPATALLGQCHLFIEDSWSHSDIPHSIGLLWISDQPDADTSTLQHSQQTNIHASGVIETHNPSKRSAADPRLIPRGHWDDF